MVVLKSDAHHPARQEPTSRKMFVTFNGSWENENLGWWIKKLDYSSYPCRLLITLDPLVIGEMDEQGTIDMEMENSEGEMLNHHMNDFKGVELRFSLI